MNKTVKSKWVKALKSGKYKQGKNCLSHAGRYCCLGVLADLAVKEGVCSRRDAFDGNEVLTAPVMKWAKLNSSNPIIGKERLSVLNDNGVPFSEIAERIKKRL